MNNNVYTRRANYYETDMMGIVHHSNHIRYFEEARLFFMNNIDCNAREMENQGIIIPNVDAYARYHTPIRFDEEIEITVTLKKVTGAVMEFGYEARLKSNGKLAAEGHTKHCFVDKSFNPMSLKRKYPDYYAKLKENVTITD